MQGYVRYVLRNTEPVRIADDSTSQNGQTNCLRYIPGTTIRGLIINALAGEEDFARIKGQLFSDEVRYLNAYLMENGRELLPSPKGFYENKEVKSRKEIENVVVDGDFREGHKRAQVGRYCYFDKECIRYYSVPTGSDMKIKINLRDNEKQNVFRNEYIAAGQTFCGYIAVNDKELAKRIKDVLGQTVVIGNGRSAGLGKCRLLSCDYVEKLPYGEYVPEGDLQGSCYMMLLSNTAMRNEEGEYCGLDPESLGKEMGVEALSVKYCATSTVEVKGHNRSWGAKTPSVTMYEQGSVFHFTYSGTLEKERIRKLCDEGIGVRRNEGFGRVIFLNDYESIKWKQQGERTKQDAVCEEPMHGEDEKVLRVVARTYYTRQLRRAMTRYITEKPLGIKRTDNSNPDVSNSRLGIIESFASGFRYEPDEGVDKIEDYFKHADEKEENLKIQKDTGSIGQLKKRIEDILNTPLESLLKMETDAGKETIMGISKKKLLSEKEEKRLKLELISKMIRYENKRG